MPCINAVSFHEDFSIESICRKILRAGFDAIEVSRPPFYNKLTTSQTRARFARWAAEQELRLHGFDCWVDVLPFSAMQETLEGFRAAVDFARELDLRFLISHDAWMEDTPSQSPAESLRAHLELFRRVADMCLSAGLHLVFEPHPNTMSMDNQWCIDFVDGLERTNVGILYDCCHYGVGQPDKYVDAIYQLGSRIRHLHFSDGDRHTYALHLPLGDGELDLPAIVHALQSISFRGTLTNDLFNYPLLEDGASRNAAKICEVEQALGIAGYEPLRQSTAGKVTISPGERSQHRMKAALLTAIGQPLEIADIPRPKIGPDEVLIETWTCGICRTDVHIQDGLAYVPSLPHVPGHEPAGVVAELGERVTGFHIGQRVVPHLFLTCGHCHYCRTGRDAQCSHVGGIIGVTTGGGFAEYFKAPAQNLLTLPDAVPFDAGGLTSCAVITAVHAYRRARIQVGDTVVVLGTGGIGQILIQILKHAGTRVVGLSRSRRSLELAKEAGADFCIQLDAPDLADQILSASDGLGAACVFECVGIASTMRNAASCLMRGGQIIVIGEEPEYPAIDTIQIAQRELEIIGSRNGSRQDAADALQWMAAGIIRPPIVKRLPLAEINAGLQMVRDGSAHGRVVVVVREGD